MNRDREIKTISAMIRLYCTENHKREDICEKCSQLTDYAIKRLHFCPYKEDKPACSKCETHCYNSEMRERVRKVMRYSGPRMILHHPVLAVEHLVLSLK